MEAEVVSIQEASHRLNVSQDVIRRLVREGELKGYRKPGADGRSPWVVELPADGLPDEVKAYMPEEARGITAWWKAKTDRTGEVHYLYDIGIEEIECHFLCGLASDEFGSAVGHSEAERCPKCVQLAKENGLLD